MSKDFDLENAISEDRKKSRVVTKITEMVIKNPIKCLLLITILTAAFFPGLLKFKEQYDVRIWFRETDPKIKTLDAFERKFGNDENLVLVMHSPSGIFDVESSNTIREITDLLWQVPQIIRVDSLSNYNYTFSEEDDILVEPFFPEIGEELTTQFLNKRKKIALSHEVMPGYLVSRDAKSVMIFARLAPNLTGSPDYEVIVRETKKFLKDFEGKYDHEFHIVGEAGVNDAFREIANNDGIVLLPLLFLLIIFYLAIIFRGIVGVLVPLVVTGFTTVATLGFCFLYGYSYNSIIAILPAILISISIADSVHVMMTFFQFKANGNSKLAACYKALHKNVIPTFLTSVSTMIGFFSLSMSELMPIRQLGVLAGIGCGYAWIVTILLVIPLLLLTDVKVPKIFSVNEQEEGVSKFSYQFALWLKKFRIPIIFIFTMASIFSLYFGAQNEVNSNPYDYFAKDTEIKVANEFVKKHFGGSAGPELVFFAGKEDGIKDPKFLKKVEVFKDWLDSRPYVNKTIDVVSIVKDMNRSLHGGNQDFYALPDTQQEVAEYLFLYTMGLPQGMDLNNRMTIKYDSMRMSILWSIYDTRGWLFHIDEFQEKAKEIGLDMEVTGKFYLFQRMMDYVVLTFFQSVTMAMFLIALLMSFVFKSIKLGVLSLIPNFLPLLFGAAAMKLTGMELNIGTALVASVCLGIAVDDTIHFLSSYYRLKKEGLSEAVTMATIFSTTGNALIVTSIILATGFGLYIFGDFIPNRNFGLLSALVLTLALVVDLIFLPALLFTISKEKKAS